VFDRFRTDGHRLANGPLWCSWIPDQDAWPPRVAFAVGRSYGGAVLRNRLRRRLRSDLQRIATQGGVPAGWYLVGPQRSAATASATDLAAAADGLMEQVRRRVTL
jgi:ribonuclease P protein component